jgi:hypothetical protein
MAYCARCGDVLPPGLLNCPTCAAAAPPPGGDEGIATLIPYRNVPALVSYYLGVFSLIPCIGGLLLGPAAVILGFLGLRRKKSNPQAKGTAHAITGIVLGSLTFIANIAGIILMVMRSAR